MKLTLSWHQCNESDESCVLVAEVVTAGAKGPYGASTNMEVHWSLQGGSNLSRDRAVAIAAGVCVT